MKAFNEDDSKEKGLVRKRKRRKEVLDRWRKVQGQDKLKNEVKEEGRMQGGKQRKRDDVVTKNEGENLRGREYGRIRERERERERESGMRWLGSLNSLHTSSNVNRSEIIEKSPLGELPLRSREMEVQRGVELAAEERMKIANTLRVKGSRHEDQHKLGNKNETLLTLQNLRVSR